MYEGDIPIQTQSKSFTYCRFICIRIHRKTDPSHVRLNDSKRKFAFLWFLHHFFAQRGVTHTKSVSLVFQGSEFCDIYRWKHRPIPRLPSWFLAKLGILRFQPRVFVEKAGDPSKFRGSRFQWVYFYNMDGKRESFHVRLIGS